MKKIQLMVNVLVLLMFTSLLMGAGVYLRGTSSSDFEIDYDNVGAAADQTITFNRGSTGIDATIGWDSVNDRVEINFPFQAVPLVYLQGTAQLTDGTTNTVSYQDDSPSGEWTDSELNAKVVMSDDATYFKIASNSLKIAYAADALVEDGTQYVTGQPYNFTDDENLGFWLYSSIALNGNDLAFELQDDGAEQVILIGAIAATTWTWVSLTLPAANADKDAISEMRLVQKVDKGAFDLYMDGCYKWDSADETALTQNILTDGDISALADITAGGAWANKARYTDYFIDYDSTDNLVVVGNESTNKWLLLYAYQ